VGGIVPVNYVSTRGLAPALGFSEVLLAGLARDGGLYVPEAWPPLSAKTIAGFAGRPYAAVAFDIIRDFVGGEIADGDLRRMCEDAYAGFRHRAVAPLVQLGPGAWALELFHGPTLAFKDLAMQLLSRLMDHILSRRGARVTIVGATSGDTGAAAVEAFRGRDNVDLFILFPEGRVSPIQQRQMTTSGAGNVHAIAVKGTFDDCQAIVKGLFNNRDFRDRMGLAGINSINWARILAQIVYYFTAAVALGAPHRPVSFSVPTGNFGDIFAGYAAKRMGLPVAKLVIATNTNDILARTLATGRYHLGPVTATASPSMDIQVSSNFERLLFESYRRDGTIIGRLMDELGTSGSFQIDGVPLALIRADFAAGRADEAETAASIRETWEATGFLPDPHTAVGLAVAARFAEPGVPMIALATAHPAKFPAAVEAATGRRPELPSGFGALARRKEHFTTVANDRAAVEHFIAARSRAVAEKV
jgi:threonine synthase